MKTTLLVAFAGLTLAGCAVVPYEPAPVVYAAPPPPVVVVRPAPVYGYGYYGGGYYGRWHRRWH
jgi:hypothetical protein